jgi:nucleotide-binding universal stress UspA family protein
MLAVPAGDLAGQLSAESDAATTALDSAVDAASGGAGVEIEKKVVEEDPGEAIISAAADADLIVVGSHGRTGLKAALLGSVSRHVVDHAQCPVVVVKAAN